MIFLLFGQTYFRRTGLMFHRDYELGLSYILLFKKIINNQEKVCNLLKFSVFQST